METDPGVMVGHRLSSHQQNVMKEINPVANVRETCCYSVPCGVGESLSKGPSSA